MNYLGKKKIGKYMKYKSNIVSYLFHNYDMFVSLGEFCFTRMILNNLGLDQYTCPFDWSASFDCNKNGIGGIIGKIDFLDNYANQDIFSYDQLVECKISSKVLPNQIHVPYLNFYNGFEYLHDFKFHKDDPIFYQSLAENNLKYKNRFSRLKKCLENNDKIMFIYVYEGARINVIDKTINYTFGHANFPLFNVIKRINEFTTKYKNTFFLLLLSDPSINDQSVLFIKEHNYEVFGIPSNFTLMSSDSYYILDVFFKSSGKRIVNKLSFVNNLSKKVSCLGFSKTESFGTWTSNKLCIIKIQSDEPFNSLLIEFFPFIIENSGILSFSVSVDNIVKKTFNISFSDLDLKKNKNGMFDFLTANQYEFIDNLNYSKECVITIIFKELSSPQKLNYNLDPRELGICVRNIYLIDTPSEA